MQTDEQTMEGNHSLALRWAKTLQDTFVSIFIEYILINKFATNEVVCVQDIRVFISYKRWMLVRII